MNSRLKTLAAMACVCVAALASLGGCSTLRVGSDHDRSASFSGYHEFTWIERGHAGSANPLVVQRARDAVEQELLARGFLHAATESKADFSVDFTIGSRARTALNSYPPAYEGRWWDLDDGWGPPLLGLSG